MTRRYGSGAPAANKARGFTLAEAVMVIVITGIIASVVAVFIQKPVQGYFDAVRRARLTDSADLALRRIGRDLRTALPNSVRVTSSGTAFYLEYIETTGGGRYRAAPDDTGSGEFLDFTAADTNFDVIGTPPASAAGEIVVANFGGGTAADAYAGTNRSAFTGVAGSTISMGSILFPVESPGKRFHVVSQAVTYECNPGVGALRRYSGYPIAAAQPTPPASTPYVLASDVTNCTIAYEASVAATRSGVVKIWLQLSDSDETVTLFHQVHVVNTP